MRGQTFTFSVHLLYTEDMKVDGFGNIKNSAPVKKRTGVSGTSSFADVLSAAEASETQQAGGISDIAAASALSGMLALQEISEDDVQKRKLIQQGNNLLDTLEDLRRQLLMGTLPLSTLRGLERELAIQRMTTSDPRLNAIIDDIEIRAAVELAKIEMAIAAKSTLD